MQNIVNQIQFWTLNRQLKPTCATCYRVKSSFIHLILFLCNSLFNKKAAGTRYGQFSGSVKKMKDKAHLASLQVFVYNTVVLTTYLNISYHIFILSVFFFSFSFQFISLRSLFRTILHFPLSGRPVFDSKRPSLQKVAQLVVLSLLLSELLLLLSDHIEIHWGVQLYLATQASS